MSTKPELVSPEASKTVSVTGQGAAEGPTPKNEFKKPIHHRQYFMSPTDAMVSPCTQKLLSSRRLPKKIGSRHQRPTHIQSTISTTSKLANKENQHVAQPPQGKIISSTETKTDTRDALPPETSV